MTHVVDHGEVTCLGLKYARAQLLVKKFGSLYRDHGLDLSALCSLFLHDFRLTHDLMLVPDPKCCVGFGEMPPRFHAKTVSYVTRRSQPPANTTLQHPDLLEIRVAKAIQCLILVTTADSTADQWQKGIWTFHLILDLGRLVDDFETKSALYLPKAYALVIQRPLPCLRSAILLCLFLLFLQFALERLRQYRRQTQAPPAVPKAKI